jgi:hypothetical protein
MTRHHPPMAATHLCARQATVCHGMPGSLQMNDDSKQSRLGITSISSRVSFNMMVLPLFSEAFCCSYFCKSIGQADGFRTKRNRTDRKESLSPGSVSHRLKRLGRGLTCSGESFSGETILNILPYLTRASPGEPPRPSPRATLGHQCPLACQH